VKSRRKATSGAVVLALPATAGHDLLTPVMSGADYSMLVSKGVSPAICIVSIAALVLLWRRRNTSALDLWLFVVMAAWLCDVALSAVVGSIVHDDGSGMPEEVKVRAFNPFFTTKEVGSGSGLGLSQVYGFAKSLGGHVEIESEVGVGITLLLPRSSEPVQTDPSTNPLPLRRARGAESVLAPTHQAGN
jgi:hypothetical protein